MGPQWLTVAAGWEAIMAVFPSRESRETEKVVVLDLCG
jgi:hypothetical protein